LPLCCSCGGTRVGKTGLTYIVTQQLHVFTAQMTPIVHCSAFIQHPWILAINISERCTERPTTGAVASTSYIASGDIRCVLFFATSRVDVVNLGLFSHAGTWLRASSAQLDRADTLLHLRFQQRLTSFSRRLPPSSACSSRVEPSRALR